MEDVKIKLAVMWLFVAVSLSAIVGMMFLVPGVIEEVMEEEIAGMQISHELLLVMAITYFLGPLVMAALSVTLKDSTNRRVNIIVGIVYTGYILIELISNITTVAWTYAILMDISAIVAAALIVWYAWKWPKKKD